MQVGQKKRNTTHQPPGHATATNHNMARSKKVKSWLWMLSGLYFLVILNRVQHWRTCNISRKM